MDIDGGDVAVGVGRQNDRRRAGAGADVEDAGPGAQSTGQSEQQSSGVRRPRRLAGGRSACTRKKRSSRSVSDMGAP